ncbi:MAG: SMP-30/gluconolactonase/LRE family protein [Nitrososphaerota archaeon]
MRKILLFLMIFFILLTIFNFSSKAQGVINEIDIPTPNCKLSDIKIDKDNIVWFSEEASGKIGCFDIFSGNITEYNINGVDPVAIYIDNEKNVWIAMKNANLIGRLNPKNLELRTWKVREGSSIRDIVIDKNGKAWLTGYGIKRIIMLDPKTDEIKEFYINELAPTKLFLKDNYLWFIAPLNNSIVCLNIFDQVVTPYKLTIDGKPNDIIVDPNDFVWVTLPGVNGIGMLNPSTGELKTYSIPTSNSEPYGLCMDSEGNIWFTEYNGNKIARLNPKNMEILEILIPTLNAKPTSIAIDNKKRIWFIEENGNKIAILETTSLPSKKDEKIFPELYLIIILSIFIGVTSAFITFKFLEKKKYSKKKT